MCQWVMKLFVAHSKLESLCFHICTHRVVYSVQLNAAPASNWPFAMRAYRTGREPEKVEALWNKLGSRQFSSSCVLSQSETDSQISSSQFPQLCEHAGSSRAWLSTEPHCSTPSCSGLPVAVKTKWKGHLKSCDCLLRAGMDYLCMCLQYGVSETKRKGPKVFACPLQEVLNFDSRMCLTAASSKVTSIHWATNKAEPRIARPSSPPRSLFYLLPCPKINNTLCLECCVGKERALSVRPLYPCGTHLRS